MATLGEQSIGSIVKLNVNGVATNFIVVHQGLPSSDYDSSCNGTWLMMENIYTTMVFDSSNNDYANSDVRAYLEDTFLNLLDSDIQSIVKQVKLPYTKGQGNTGSLATGSSGLSSKVFLISYTECGQTTYTNTYQYAYVEGATLSYFAGASTSKVTAKYNGTNTAWWFRTPHRNNSDAAWLINTQGYDRNQSIGNSNGVRPALILPSDANVDDSGMVVTSSGGISGKVNIGGVLKEFTGEGYVNISGVWKELVKSYVNIDGVWKDASEKVENNVTISITQASTDTSHCYLQIGDTKYTTVQDITVPSGTKVTFRVFSDYEAGAISVNDTWIYDSGMIAVAQDLVYMDLTTNISVSFSCGSKANYIYITTEDGKQYAYDISTSYIVPTKTMTIGGNSYAFEEGMTWGEWVDSSYNTGYNGNLFTSSSSLGVFCNIVENGYDMCHQVVYNNSVQSGSDAIVEGREYSFKITNMGPA